MSDRVQGPVPGWRPWIRWSLAALALLLLAAPGPVRGQQPEPPDAPARDKPSSPVVPVTTKPKASDEDIRIRIDKILKATGKYRRTEVEVKDGIVFLRGQAQSERLKDWAAETAGKVEDVVAVFNGIVVEQPSPWDLSPALESLQEIWAGLLQATPFIAFGLVVLVLAYVAARATTWLALVALRRQQPNRLLRMVFARGLGLAVFVLGLYLVLQVAGLTRLALTVVGGTGLLGLVLGIAFRDITENFLASIFLSLQQPFNPGDLVELAGVLGYVQRMTYRVTVLMTLNGNLVQVPNSTVYKSTLRNFTANPNRREDFVIGISLADAIPRAQEIALRVLAEHPTVLKEPEPWVLVDELRPGTVNLRVYFWLNGREHSWLKVRSSVIRLVKRAFQEAGLGLPDDYRRVVFPQQVPVRMLEHERQWDGRSPAPAVESDAVATAAETNLSSEAGQLEAQARHAQVPEKGEDLLRPAAGDGRAT